MTISSGANIFKAFFDHFARFSSRTVVPVYTHLLNGPQFNKCSDENNCAVLHNMDVPRVVSPILCQRALIIVFYSSDMMNIVIYMSFAPLFLSDTS